MAERPSRARITFGFVAFPRCIWDDNLEFSLAEFRVFGYIIRHTLCFGKDQVKLTREELVNGRRKHDGSRMDAGCGVTGTNNLREALERLEGRKWILMEPIETYRNQTTYAFSVNVDSEGHLGSNLSETDRIEGANLSETDKVNLRNGQGQPPKRTRSTSETDRFESGACNERAYAHPQKDSKKDSEKDSWKESEGDGRARREAVEGALFDYFGTLPDGALVVDFLEVIDHYLAHGTPVSPDQIRSAAHSARDWWNEAYGGYPTTLKPLKKRLADLVKPLPSRSPKRPSGATPHAPSAEEEVADMLRGYQEKFGDE